MFIQPGKSSQNGYIECFNRKLRDECLNGRWFLGLADAREILGAWHYNTNRPHTILGGRTLDEVASAVAGGGRAMPFWPGARCTAIISDCNSHLRLFLWEVCTHVQLFAAGHPDEAVNRGKIVF